MRWIKKGLIFNVDGSSYCNKSHAHVVCALRINNNIVRIYYSSRDEKNRCFPSFIDINSKDFSNVVYVHDKPILKLGDIGTFDDRGVMPTWVLRNNDEIWLYYIGWNVRNTVPYHNSIGLAYSKDGINFKRKFKGPLIHRTYIEPYFNGSACIVKENKKWRCWYLSCTHWEVINGRVEPFYHIKYAESKDGIHWNQNGIVAIDYKYDNEGGISRPSVILSDGIYKMWYSYRGKTNYRENKEFSYRIGYAESKDGIRWNRKDDKVGIDISREGWDSEMIEYPFVFEHEGKLVMFYNGNGFGKSGFGYAILEKG